jgi:hypothetical protein
MRTYTLTTPTDVHGQPVRLFKKIAANNASKAIDQLSGICAGILADGKVSAKEVEFFAQWVAKFAPLEPTWPFTDILSRIERIFADGYCDDAEREELKSVMETLCGYTCDSDPSKTYATSLPLDSPMPVPVILKDRVFNITGRFAFGTRQKVMEAIEQGGGIPSDSSPTRQSHYLVIGLFASRDWAHTNYGRKIERAVELRESGSRLAIISEEHWKKFVA